MIYDWIREMIEVGKACQEYTDELLTNDEIFYRDLYHFTKGFKVPEKEYNKFSKISTNCHKEDNKIVDKFEINKIKLANLTIYKKRYKALKDYLTIELNKYNKKRLSGFADSYSSITYNEIRKIYNRIESIEKEFPIIEEKKNGK